MSGSNPGTRFLSGRREHGWFRSLLRVTGLTAAGRSLYGGLWSTRDRRVITGGTACAVVAAIVLTALLFPETLVGSGIRSLVNSPKTVFQAVLPGTQNADLSKEYPRLYSRQLGIDLAIKPGDGNLHPPVQPIAFQWPHTAPLGQPGNTYLYAHDRPGMFLGLHQAHIGDVVVVFVTPTQKLYYEITEIHQNVPWNDAEWLTASADVRMTMQTCNLAGDYDPRFVVVTHEVSAAQGAAAAGV